MLKLVIYLALLLVTNISLAYNFKDSENSVTAKNEERVADVDVDGPDYHFVREVDGWLKLHKLPQTWKFAMKTCLYEGAVLASPINPNLTKALTEPINTWGIRAIYVGANALFSQGDYISIEGKVLTDQVNVDDSHKLDSCLRFGNDRNLYTTSCDQPLPYICYKKRDENTVENECGTFDNGYKLNNSTGKCYKFHEYPRNWNESHKICIAEGGHLVIINDKTEADAITALLPDILRRAERNIAHIGMKDWGGDINWLTIHGQRTQDVYNVWGQLWSERMGGNACGCIQKNGNLCAHWCLSVSKFICEKDPKTSRFEKVPENLD